MAAALDQGRYPAARLDASVRRVLAIKQRLGLLAHRTVAIDSIMTIVGTRRAQDAADDIAVRSVTLARDTTGIVRAWRARRGRLALIAYADEQNGGIGQRFADILRQNGDTVDYFRLWPMSGVPSDDSACTVVARNPNVVLASGVRPISWRGDTTPPRSLGRPRSPQSPPGHRSTAPGSRPSWSIWARRWTARFPAPWSPSAITTASRCSRSWATTAWTTRGR